MNTVYYIVYCILYTVSGNSIQKKKLIIDELKSKEKTLLGNVEKNPKIWNNKSLKINLKSSQNISSQINVDVTLTQVGFQFEI